MGSTDVLAGLDIGSSQVRVIVAETVENRVERILGVGAVPAQGVKRGAIVNVDQVVDSIGRACDDVSAQIGIRPQSVYVGVHTAQITLLDSHGVVGVGNEGQEITADDVDRVLRAAEVVALPPERTILSVQPKQFIVDGLDEIESPHGMMGVRLEVDALLVTASKQKMQNLFRCVERAGLRVRGGIFFPLAEGAFCLTEEERFQGVLLINLGGGVTTVTIFERGHLAAVAVLPLGAEYVTNDIAIGLRVSSGVAEEIKRKYAVSSREYASHKDFFFVRSEGAEEDQKVTLQDLARIVEPRMEETFQLIREHVQGLGFCPNPPGGCVITGGGAALSHVAHTAQRQLGTTVRIAVPPGAGSQNSSRLGCVSMVYWLQRYPELWTDIRQDPVVAVGGSQKSLLTKYTEPNKQQRNSPLRRVRNWLSEFM